MTFTDDDLRELCRRSTELSAYFAEVASGSLSGKKRCEVNLLTFADVVRWTDDFRDFHPIVAALKGLVLDDPNTSNHHLYLSIPTCDGCVFYLNHDGDSRIVFAGLSEYLAACRTALTSNRFLSDLHPQAAVLLPDQRELSSLIEEQLRGDDEWDGNAVALGLIPSLDLTDFALLERLAKDGDFYLGEAVGDAIAIRPRTDLLPIALMCAEHSHPQVARAGQRARSAIRAEQR